MLRRLLFAVVCLWISSAPGTQRFAFAENQPAARPKIILIIRHAEKPDTDSPDLSPRGFERAAALAKVIPSDFATPDFLFATHKSKHSERPVETITPLSKAIHQKIDSKFADDQFEELAKQILSDARYANKVVLIAWHHGKIPELAHALGASDAPSKWNSEVFDRVWKISYHDGHAEFSDLPEHALSGDSAK